VLVRPGVLEPRDGGGRKPAGVLAEQCQERLLEVAGRIGISTSRLFDRRA
jgi:hypothetical protein